MKALIIALTFSLFASTTWAATFVNPMTYDDSQKDQLVAFAREMAIKNYGENKKEIVEFVTNELVNSCIWLSENGTDKVLLKDVVEYWHDMDGDYMMMKFVYEQNVARSSDDVDIVIDGYKY